MEMLFSQEYQDKLRYNKAMAIGLQKGEEKGRQEGIEEGMEKGERKGRQEGGLYMLFDLAKAGAIPLNFAASKANLSEPAFIAEMNRYFATVQ